ncbi:MAG: ADP-ribosylglycohydrolase family protein [Nitrospirota bacterium]|jgi:poly(ADP-ribose) glycohydrolase ARH3
MAFSESAFKGCLAGLALGDALGAPFEGLMPPLESGVEAFFEHLPEVLRYTDDTEMAIGVAESLAERGCLDLDHVARRFAENFDPSRGYGPGTVSVLGMIRRGASWRDANRAVFPEGSFGNGAAMRAAPLGLFYAGSPEDLREATFAASSITHDHPLAKEGALLIAGAVSAILGGKNKTETLDEVSRLVGADAYRQKLRFIKEFMGHPISPGTVIERLGHGVLAEESAPTALYAYLKEGRNYLKCIWYCISLGGDTDTICAMAGALSGAKVGLKGLPQEMLERLEDRDRILSLAEELFRAAARK